ncbi:P-loop containing nucleoside triphosphate hydrolase protein [Polychytrium aggregatum]|uniref:P-loop containing nucleoside triphosphate hydrolase protein n=1 Tax=Polychytrium aggregatum TaxID=110093 RepID=UPI0022FF4095|nr:P-loop containing nucleoside triphosphate hydrolase protein [Polychytrium aggregatum]KAI9206004.1 P-loop containing nucleoside triphosphate hydrolase protein [Polychytrium aggregatum]
MTVIAPVLVSIDGLVHPQRRPSLSPDDISLLSLPDHILRQIFLCLDHPCALTRTCRLFRDMARSRSGKSRPSFALPPSSAGCPVQPPSTSYRFVVTGPRGVGKTALSVRIGRGNSNGGELFHKRWICGARDVRVCLLDYHRDVLPWTLIQQLRTFEGFICTYAVDSRDSFERAKDHLIWILWLRLAAPTKSVPNWVYDRVRPKNAHQQQAGEPVQSISRWQRRLTALKSAFRHPLGGPLACPIPIILVASKCDLEPAQWTVSEAEGRELANQLGCGFRQVSAKTGEGVDQVLDWLVGRVATDDSRARLCTIL